MERNLLLDQRGLAKVLICLENGGLDLPLDTCVGSVWKLIGVGRGWLCLVFAFAPRTFWHISPKGFIGTSKHNSISSNLFIGGLETSN
jgi:hypothetical protein